MNSIIKDRIEKIEEGIIPEGYKKTKVGIIPIDWEVKKLAKLAKITMGQSPKSENYNNEGIGLPLVQGNADMKLGYTCPKMYTSEITKVCDIGDIILSVRAPVGALAISKHNACIGRGVCSIEANKFIYYYLLKNQDKLRRYSQGSTFSAINSSDIRGLLIKTPPLKEQEEIAHILSTWDRAIENIEKLIKEKKTQKKGLMQELLTGKTRLAGFTDDWEEVRLGEVLKLQGGYAFKSEKYLKDGGIPIIRISNIQDSIDFENNLVYYNKIDISSDFELKNGDILIAMSGATTGKTAVYRSDKKAYLNQRVGKFITNEKKLSNRYLMQIVSSKLFLDKMATRLVAGAQPNISGKDVETLDYSIPLLPEQKAIAEILSTADKEIELLNQLLEAKKEEKKGLMQLLLTGIVRV